jgi:xanthine dehydrogenase accessory factor
MSSAAALEVLRAAAEVLSGARRAGGAGHGDRPHGLGAAGGRRAAAAARRRLDGRHVGGGAIEAQVLDACRSTLRDGSPQLVKAHLVRDLGMCCGGSMEVFVEYLDAQARLILIGAGHVAQAIAPVAAGSAFGSSSSTTARSMLAHPAFVPVTSTARRRRRARPVDPRPRRRRLPGDRDPRPRPRRAGPGRRAAPPHRYIGMIGSRRKVHAILARILRREQQLGRPPPDLTRLRAPVGLALGGRTPAEIAVSVVAELLADRHGGHGARHEHCSAGNCAHQADLASAAEG